MKQIIFKMLTTMKRISIAQFVPILTLAAILIFIPEMSYAKEITMPWEPFLQDIADTLTGTTAMTLATIGIAICGIGLFLGNGGDGFRKFLIVILGLCIVLWAGKAVKLMYDSAKQGSLPVVMKQVASIPSNTLHI